ncbi:unnamed protein product [Rotaria magnacalcarata]|uniref:ER membrane protein complex subunit 2 n=2 Tax=Rotaria magnacalcarata TaxID=392030 RepID=A0A820J1V7_9BILA|nr:unnamed protein product [Rotaria magnacalcarata]
MQSAIEKLIVIYQTLGDEKWIILKQVFKSALNCSNKSLACQCLEQLEKQFKETSPHIITLHAMYFESIGELDKAQEIYSTLTADNTTDVIKKLIDLVNHLLDVCENIPDIPLTCLNTIK